MAMPNIDKLMAFENGELDQDEVVELFQDGINNGWVWKLQGFYGRTAMALIQSGLCHQRARNHFNDKFEFVNVK